MRKSKIKTVDIRTHIGVSCAFACREIEGILVANSETDLKALFSQMCGSDCKYDPEKSKNVIVMLDKNRNEDKEKTA